MQFVARGPDIPDALLQAQEEGRVVFFCGAGISYPAGVPGFEGLVDDIYRVLGTALSPLERDVYDNGRYDATLDLLERRHPGQRIAVRKALNQILQPKLRRKKATDTHAALLQLSRHRDGALRLVTTNFDRIFEHVAKILKQEMATYAAPMLPIPKKIRWNGLVYLHGLLPAKADDSALHQLVITSGDFGLAYLTERWAARFVSELFRNYVVCFVGYSINDPVLRYMMDALAADRMLGEVIPQAYALGDYEYGREQEKKIEWSAKGVTPILYEVPTGSRDHSALHNTIRAWADTYRDGVFGKERIVVDYALARPSGSTVQDDFVGRMLWALSDESGLPAKRFADFNPVPPLEWLEALSENRYEHHDLNRFGVPPRVDVDDKLLFSLVQRPASYRHAPWMTLVSHRSIESQWDDVMFQLARWLTRHLNSPDLVIWLSQRGGRLHGQLSRLIEHELDRLSKLQAENNESELAKILAQSPDAIPGSLMKTLWRLLLTERVKAPWHELDFYRWLDRLKRDGLTATLRAELRDLLGPRVKLGKPLRWGAESETVSKPTHISQLVDWELVLASDYINSTLPDSTDRAWQLILPNLLDDFQQLLRDALDLLSEMGRANDRSDRSHWDLPSISEHWQNRGFHDWVTLIELLRDAWLAVRNIDPPRAARIAQTWFDVPYPTFKRLGLFAASQDNCINPAQWVDWLLIDDAWWLWAEETRREVMRVIVLQGSRAPPPAQARLEAAILSGPPRKMYRDDIEPEHWEGLINHSVWLRLAKLRASGAVLVAAADRLGTLEGEHADWKLAADESDEFSHWSIGTGDPGYEEKRDVDIAPRTRRDLVKWLKQPQPKGRPFYEDTWQETCRTRLFHSLGALCDLSQEGIWPADRWREALQAWSEDKIVLKAWHYAAPLIRSMPEEVIQELTHGLTWWLEKISKSIDRHEDILLEICRRILILPLDAASGITRNGQPINQPVTEAINHPIGHVTQTLLNLWFKRKPNDNDQLPTDLEPLFRQLCDLRVARFRHGRVLLASRLLALFRVDRSWTEKHLLPLFNWATDAIEARSAWEGFLWSPRLYRELMIAFKEDFLATASHYSELGDHSRQFAAFLTYAALEPTEGYTTEDFRVAFAVLPEKGLQEAAQALSQALSGAGAQREEYWRNRIQPFWHHIWPKSGSLVTKGITESLTRLCIAAGSEFPQAVTMVYDWLRPVEHPHFVVHLLNESKLCPQFPADALRLLDVVIDKQPWAPHDLGKCLKEIGDALPALRSDHKYQRLVMYLRQHGGSPA